MGKDWLYWGGGGSSSSTKTGGGGGGRSTKKGRVEGNHTASGCMNAVFQLFDFHHFQFPLHHQRQVPPPLQPDSFLPEKPIRGVEAPRNSLEMEEAFASFPSSTMKGVESFNIPMGIQVKTRTDDLSSEFSTSPGSKTPNLVARLMGLDVLPPADTCSTSSSSSTCVRPSNSRPQMGQSRSSRVGARHLLDTDIIGTRSLPETPRISSARRSDVEYHHRLSLQITKENAGATDDLSAMKGVRRRDQVLRHEDENLSPGGRYARQIVKQVKEKVSRRAGLDITNTIRNRETRGRDHDDGDDHVVLLKVRKPSKGPEIACDESSPRLRKQNQATTHSPKLTLQSPLSSSVVNGTLPQLSKVPLKQKSQPVVLVQDPEYQKHRKTASHDQGHSPLFKKHPANSNVYRNKQEEPFVRSSSVTNRANHLDKKSKKTPLSSDLLNTNVPTLFPVKKDHPSSSAARFPQKTAHGGSDAVPSKRSPPQLSSSTSQVTYKLQANKHTPTVQDLISLYNSSNGATNGGGTAFHYITRILKRAGIDKNAPLSFAQWYSPLHPLNPSLFNHLEISFPIPTTTAGATTLLIDSHLKHRCIRKLIFQLVDEILVEILKPYVSLNPWGSWVWFGHSIHGSELIEKICVKIRSFPSADCRVLEDIDALIENDLGRSELRGAVALEEEGEAIVAELEEDLVESLVHEITMGVL
ncbi:hypothetical protein RHMOL_Rhmol03G0202500 [Rhododendron molle]|uniref:Uncharacterized protein n=1 Tax=Rhododendron molle TaxID=49168 RepID=A0ACC0PI56_RHOML|nr:hypothetical protein RHMOL_Rhmol03G0202500 [Rhododendron molle]